ncbi:MAG: hypothetical protein E7525_01210 [Ruminococcaceae bacterium]|nr:hypothetical protein [Oscillospiraceae bacterium]
MNSKFAKSRKYIVIAFFIIASVLSVLLMSKVAINYNISDYLDKDTETKISLEIIENEFGSTGDVQIMIEGISVDTAKDVCDSLKEIENVLTVNFNEYDEGYYKNGNALFVAIVDGDEYSEVANGVVENIKSVLNKRFEGKVSYGGAIMEKANLRESIEEEIPFILAIAVCLVIAIMLITSKSWIEPFILLLTSGVAILINMGTNAMFGKISYITNAVAAILQLALSIDYSIVLLHCYRKFKETEADNSKAMTEAIKEVIKPVSASALTTIAGLLALLFMSMRIGFDIGIVLMKGIVISAIISLTLLPALLLIFDTPLNKTQKRELVIRGKRFCQISFKAGKIIVPIALILIMVCSYLQFGNSYSFTDSKKYNSAISDTFGRNNTVVVVYPYNKDNHVNEIELAERLNAYRTADGKPVLKNYTAYSNTVREFYDVELASRKLGLSVSDVELLFTTYHLYNGNSSILLTPLDFINYTNELITNDADAEGFADEEMTKTIRTMLVIDKMMNGKHTAKEFHTLATTGVMEGTNLSLFSIKQMYGLYLYNKVTDKTVDFETMLDFMLAASKKEETAEMFEEKTVTDLTTLSQGLKEFNSQMEMPMTKAQFQDFIYKTSGEKINDLTAALLYASYYYMLGQPTQETIPFLDLLNFLVAQNQITDPATVATIDTYNSLYKTVNADYSYEQFLPILTQITTTLSGTAPTISVTDLAIQQIYIMYFYEHNAIPNTAISGRTFVEFVKSTMLTNSVINAQISEDGKAKISDMCVADEFLSDTTAYNFTEMAAKITDIGNNLKSGFGNTALSSDKISGVYIKYAVASDNVLTEAIEARDLLNFVVANMETNEILKGKMSDDNRSKVTQAQNSMNSATELFVGENYSRMLLSIDLVSESDESSAFVAYLLSSVKEIFGENAHIAGEMVSTYDLQNTFDDDSTLISIFTIVSIFVIVMLVFRSLSLPVVLVAVIQGAIWIAMSTSLLTGPMFFMSYIMATCILMGATIDYGILMSTNYVQYRQTVDKQQALYRSVEAAMPTIFTSGMCLTICGFLIGFLSSQNAIATVGTLIGKGTIVSVIMITLVLPSLLYLLDGFILKLSMVKKDK